MGYFVLYVALAAAGCFAGRTYLHLNWFWSVASAMSAAGAILAVLVSPVTSRRAYRWVTRRGYGDPNEVRHATLGLGCGLFTLLLPPLSVGLAAAGMRWPLSLGVAVCGSAVIGLALAKAARLNMEKAAKRARQRAGNLSEQWWGTRLDYARAAGQRWRAHQTAVPSSEATEGGLLRCNNCGRKQRRGDWVEEMDRRSRAKYGTEFVNLSAPEQCLKCGSTDLVDASQPRQTISGVPSEVAELAARFARAGREWEEAHTLGLSEAQRGVMTHYYSIQQTKKEKEEEIKKLIAEARAKGVLYEVIGLLQRKGETAAVQLLNAYL